MPQKDIDRHNRNVLSTLSKGDLVEFQRGAYSHWGIYAGDEDIIHLVTDEKNYSTGIFPLDSKKIYVRKNYFFDVTGDSKARKNNYLDHKLSAYKPDEIVKRAMSKIGRTDYSLFTSNCEHFVTWCRYGEAISLQAKAVEIAGAVTTALGAAAGIGVTLLKLL